MAEVGLAAEVRDGRGKGAARKLRAKGQVPAVLYGLGEDPVPIAVSARELAHTLATDAGMNVLVDLQVNGDTHLAIPREVDKDPIKGTITHIDFLRINRNQRIAVDVPIHLEGTAAGVKEGGMLDQHTYALHIEALPGNLPERIEVDISGLGLNDSLRVADITAAEGIDILTPGDEVIVSCIVPQDLPTEPELEEVSPEAEAAAASEATPPPVEEGS